MNSGSANLTMNADKKDIHVFPIDDLLPHDQVGTDCMCDPRIEIYGAWLMIVHNSYDGREADNEEAECQLDVSPMSGSSP